MNDNNLNNNVKYKATSNLNTAIENPEINVNNATDVNVQGLENNNYFLNNNQEEDNELINNYNENIDNNLNNINSNSNQEDYNNYATNNNIANDTNAEKNIENNYITNNNTNYTYEPTLSKKKIGKENFVSNLLHSQEFKALIFIVLILCIFLLVMPYIYDFIKGISLIK